MIQAYERQIVFERACAVWEMNEAAALIRANQRVQPHFGIGDWLAQIIRKLRDKTILFLSFRIY